MCYSGMNLLQAVVFGPLLIYEGSHPNPNILRTLGALTIIYHLYQLYMKGELPDLSETPQPPPVLNFIGQPRQGLRLNKKRF